MTLARPPICSTPLSKGAAVPEIDRHSDVLSPEIRAAWPIVATAVKRLRGSLVGGTALTLTLRHRESYEARRALGALRTPPLTPRDNDPPDRPSASRARSRCGAWMPVSRAHCRLPRGHRGHHRSR